jgi:hypothetical protein
MYGTPAAAGFSPVTSSRFSKGANRLMALYSLTISSSVNIVLFIGLLM